MKKVSFTATLWLIGSGCLTALGEGTPRIEFERTVYDFGQTSQVASVSGIFRFRNTGEAVLRLEPPKPSCGCTVAELKLNTLSPGATGELGFTLNLGFRRATLEKHIAVRSNDPQTPEISLIIKVDYTPLYEIEPMILAPKLAFGVNEATQATTLSRTDGKPFSVARLEASKSWITATVEPGAELGKSTARIRVEVKREGAPRRFNEYVQIYTSDQTNTPASSIYVYGQMLGEISLSPEALYWSVPDVNTNATERPEALITRRVRIDSANGAALELKNPQSTVKGLTVELVRKEPGLGYELVARLDQSPSSTVSGNVSFETSLATQPRIEVPIIVNVFKP